MKGWRSLLLMLFLVLDAGAVYYSQVVIDGLRGDADKAAELMYLPKGEYLKKVSLEYNMLMADLLWLKTIQVMGEKNVPPENAKWIYNALDVASDLDPLFSYMYEGGGIFLSTVTGEFELSNKLLRKGFDNNPQSWHLPFYLGVNYFLHMEDYKRAAYFMGRAAEIPGRPAVVALLATRLYAEAGDPRFALELVERVYENTQDERARSELEKRMKELVVEINLSDLTKAVDAFHKQFNRYPGSVQDLLVSGLISRPPSDPLGGRYIIDPATGEVKSTALKRRLKTFKKGEKG
jgi:hypothetical protein